jgi:hypothetical protein
MILESKQKYKITNNKLENQVTVKNYFTKKALHDKIVYF